MDPALERAEADALATIYQGLPGGRVDDVGGWAVRSWPARPQSTWMHQAAVVGPVTAVSFDTALAELEPLPVLAQVPTGTLDEAELRRRGFGSPTRQLRLVAPAGGPPPQPACWLESVGPQGGGDVSAVSRQGSGIDEPWWWVAPLGSPGWTQLVVYDGDAPLATGALHVAGELAWLGAASTVPGARGRGAHTALLAHRLRLAADLGAGRVVAKAQPGSASHRNLLRAGFAPAYEVIQWCRPGPSA